MPNEIQYLQWVKSYITGLKEPFQNDDPEDQFNKGVLWAAERIENHLTAIIEFISNASDVMPEVMEENVRNKLDKTKHINL